jgi:membrane fusion protein, multidrug efflux system
MVEVRGRVDGYIEQRAFQIGSPVRAGQVLYLLDRRPYQAEVARTSGEVAQATADLAQAEANLMKARQDVERLKPLVQGEAAARQDLDNAQSALDAAQATVSARRASIEAARASLRTAELNLEYATIRAPISGRIGDSLLQVGGLVTRTSAQPLTTIVPLDAIWVRFKVGEAQAALFQRPDARSLPIALQLPDGSTWPHEGRIQNTLNQVDPKTGTLEVQVKFPNPDGALLPGQFGRVRVRTAERRNALLVPQKAVQELQGLQSVLTLGPQNAVQVRNIVTGSRVGERWIVEQGLVAGDTVVVEGLQKARPGAKVTPRPYASALRAAAGKPASAADARADEE